MLYAETTTVRALTRRLVTCPVYRHGNEPQVIVAAVYITPEYLGGGREEVDIVLPARSYYRLMRARTR